MNKLIKKIINKQNIAIVGIAIFFIADRLLKSLALNNVDRPAANLIGRFFFFDFHPNRYLAFSLPLQGWPIIGLILLIIVLLIYKIFYLILNKKDQKWLIILLTFILFGAISNILDRLMHGYVIDYLVLRYLTVFNLADVIISLGTIIIILCYAKKSRISK
jgi:signal peptidase II